MVAQRCPLVDIDRSVTPQRNNHLGTSATAPPRARKASGTGMGRSECNSVRLLKCASPSFMAGKLFSYVLQGRLGLG